MLVQAIRDGLALLTWQQDTFAYAESYDEAAGRYRGLRGGQVVSHRRCRQRRAAGEAGRRAAAAGRRDAQRAAGRRAGDATGAAATAATPVRARDRTGATPCTAAAQPKRFHGTVTLDPTRVGRDASRIADEVIAHLAGLVGAEVTVTLEIEAEIPSGAPDHVVRTVTENSRTLKFTSQGFEKE